jgi:DNA-binding beta-propeller fold protein YncE
MGSSGTGNGQFDGPTDPAVDQSSGNLYVADTGNSRFQKFTSTGTFIRSWSSFDDGNPTPGLVIHNSPFN